MGAVQLQIAAHVGAGQPQIAGGGEDVAQPTLVEDLQAVRRVEVPGLAAVEGAEPERQATVEESVDRCCDVLLGHRFFTAFS
ncbi:hypothetical protein JCM18899A_36510 [Nocardioides sp. AN3]